MSGNYNVIAYGSGDRIVRSGVGPVNAGAYVTANRSPGAGSFIHIRDTADARPPAPANGRRAHAGCRRCPAIP